MKSEKRAALSAGNSYCLTVVLYPAGVLCDLVLVTGLV